MSPTLATALIACAILVLMLAALRVMRMTLQNLLLVIIGAIVGLLLGALLSIPLSNLPSPYGTVLPLVGSVALTLLAISVSWRQRASLVNLLPVLGQTVTNNSGTASVGRDILVDTSVIIDGRIADIAKAGFMRDRLCVPRFVLAELQNIADSDDPMRRGRGRRGLETLNSMRDTEDLEVIILDDDPTDIKEVDHKLVAVAKIRNADVLTTDYNLNRVAQIDGVRVLNINELANAIRPVVLPGEPLLVKIVQAGKEKNQGVGYLADGTMIVVEEGDKMIGQDVACEVTRVFQTVAGKMIFAVPQGSHKAHMSQMSDNTSKGSQRKSFKGQPKATLTTPTSKQTPAVPIIAPTEQSAPRRDTKPKYGKPNKTTVRSIEDSLMEMTGSEDSK